MPHPSPVVITWPGEHAPSPEQVPSGSHAHEALHRRACVPQNPQGTESVAPAAQTPSPSHGPEDHAPPAVQKRASVPHLPHETRSIAPGMGQPSGMQAVVSSNTQAALHVSVRVWDAGQPSTVVLLAPGAQAPSPAQSPTVSQAHASVQRLACVPQLPHDAESIAPGAQAPSPVQGP